MSTATQARLHDPTFPDWARDFTTGEERGTAHRVDGYGIAICGARVHVRVLGHWRVDLRCKKCVKLGKSEPMKMKKKRNFPL